jgi:preprotein translocase subunit SecY
VLGDGEITRALKVTAAKFSASAKAKIEKAGGQAIVGREAKPPPPTVFSAFTNSLKIPELRSRIFYTLALLFVARVGAHIPLPGIDPHPLQEFFASRAAAGGAVLGLYNMFTGGALTRGAVCALGIMPYISASIIFQLMTAVVPALSRLQQEGDVGRQKLTQYTRYATVLICIVQGALLILALENHPGS